MLHQRFYVLVLLALGLAFNTSLIWQSTARAAEAEIVSVQKIWDQAPHNAFTDLIHYKGEWFCVFREGLKHVSPDGALRVLVSKDGEKWESAALITADDCDLRDAKINVTPDGKLMLCGAGYMDKYDDQKKAKKEITTHSHESYSWFSDDGRNWTKRKLIGDKNNWLWRVTWHKGKAYGVGYNTSPQMPKGTNLYRSEDGKDFERFIPKYTDEDRGYTNETSIIFTPDDTAYCLLRRDGKQNTSLWGTARPPYDKWTWQDMGTRQGGPHMLQLPDGRIVAAVRLYDKPVRTSLCWIDPDSGELTEFQKLPSGGDTSYAGLVYKDNLLWVSYYSSHEGKTSIYLAKVKIAPKAQALKKKNVDRPNIVFLFSDDHAPWAVGAAGDPHAVTPHMDRIYREGAVFPNSFTVTPVCSPSRAELMTSRYGSEVGITDWINPRSEPTHGLDPRYPVWPRLLAEAGYKTGLVGKWHLGTEDRFHPTVFGYQHFMGFRSGGNRPKDPTLEVNGKETKLKGLLPDILTDNAIEFINENAAEPFLLSLHYRAPHAPWLPVADEDWSPYKDLDPKIPNPDYPKLDTKFVKKKTREYLASVSSVDRNIGRVLDELDRLNLSENTVVIYSSDHGYNMGHNGIWHKGNGHWILTESPPGTKNVPKKQRPNMYDHSIRVPTAIRYPKLLKPGTVIDETITNMDWFPTLLELAGVDVPTGAKIHGRSFVPLMKNQTAGWNNDLYCEYSTHHQSKTHMRMYRTQDWKLVRDFLNPERHELYNLKNDPAETTNLINSEDPGIKAVTAALHQKILSAMNSINDPILKSSSKSTSLMISGNENKIDLHTGGARVVPGKYPSDSISILDFSTFPPQVQHLEGISNTVVGPPSNIAITPNHEIALIASSLKLDPKKEDGFGPDDLIHVLDLTTSPPRVIQEVRLGNQPSGMSITPDGKLAIVANRAEGTITVIRIRGKQVTPLEEIVVDVPESSVSDVAIAPDGKTGLISVQEGCYLAQFKIEGEKVSLTGRKFNTYGRPYRCVISPDGDLGLTAGAGLGDGAPNVDALTVVDLSAKYPHTSSVVTIGAIPESIEISPNGQLVAAVVMGSSNYDKQNPLFKNDAEVVLLERKGKEFSVVQKLLVGRIPEGVAFTSDGKYLVVQCHVARELHLFEVNGNRLSDTGERISLPGFASSLRAAP